jgi:hypothetical protein
MNDVKLDANTEEVITPSLTPAKEVSKRLLNHLQLVKKITIKNAMVFKRELIS